MRSPLNNLIDHLLSWAYIRRLWGPRCTAFEPECIVCRTWAEHDEIFNDTRPYPVHRR